MALSFCSSSATEDDLEDVKSSGAEQLTLLPSAALAEAASAANTSTSGRGQERRSRPLRLLLCCGVAACCVLLVLMAVQLRWRVSDLSHIASDGSTAAAAVNVARLARLLHRLDVGLPVVVGGIGGSNIAASHLPLKAEQSMVALLTAWLNQRFPVDNSSPDMLLSDNTAIHSTCRGHTASSVSSSISSPISHQHINRGVGGTTSAMSGFCYRRLVPCLSYSTPTANQSPVSGSDYYHDPDLLLIEFSLNDMVKGVSAAQQVNSGGEPQRDIERLVRQVLVHTRHTAIVFVHVSRDIDYGMENGADTYRAVAERYHIPEINFPQWVRQHLYEPTLRPPLPRRAPPAPDVSFDRLLPSSLQLPLAVLFNKSGVDTGKELWKNSWHINELGHGIVAAQLADLLLSFHRNLRATNYSSLSDPLGLPEGVRGVAHSLLLEPPAAIPPPIFPSLARADQNTYDCVLMYYPFNPQPDLMTQKMAVQFMHVEANTGWTYIGDKGTGTVKYSMSIAEADSAELGQLLTIQFPAAVNSVVVVWVRTWNTTAAGDAVCWLSCSANTTHDSAESGPELRLQGTWDRPNTQGDSLEIWPLNDALAPLLLSPETDSSINSSSSFTRTPSLLDYKQPDCALRYLHLRHSSPGTFKLVGYMYN